MCVGSCPPSEHMRLASDEVGLWLKKPAKKKVLLHTACGTHRYKNIAKGVFLKGNQSNNTTLSVSLVAQE